MLFKGSNGELICMYFHALGVKDRVGTVVLSQIFWCSFS